ncbi:hypothetical protein GCM10022239_03500 [Leifsonia bigeumensis]|uniref:Uncharacterized protein n=1 Tax=Leifsonella bigeumensis TaxID=433643 RepID=A0ABP7F3L2_9MICO
MTLDTSTRPGYADIRIGGIQFGATNLHRANPDARWTTGIYGDRWTKPNGERTWWVMIALLGFGIEACK